MATKTPISTLQETMTRLGTLPKYDLIYDGTGTHIATYQYRVTAIDETAVGIGRSKKEAKHNAARLVLDKLAQKQTINTILPATSLEPLLNSDMPPQDEIQGNVIGALLDMCVSHSIPRPEYKLIDEKGEPHAKIFTIACCIRKRQALGTARTKKQAKHIAASNMMKILKESLSEILKDIEEGDKNKGSGIEAAAAKYKAAVGTPVKKIKLDQNFSTYSQFFIDTDEELLQKGREILKKLKRPLSMLEDESLMNVDTDWMEILQEITSVMNLPVNIVPCNRSKKGECAFIQIAHTSDAVFYGVASCFEGAVQKAALSAVRFIERQLM